VRKILLSAAAIAALSIAPMPASAQQECPAGQECPPATGAPPAAPGGGQPAMPETAPPAGGGVQAPEGQAPAQPEAQPPETQQQGQTGTESQEPSGESGAQGGTQDQPGTSGAAEGQQAPAADAKVEITQEQRVEIRNVIKEVKVEPVDIDIDINIGVAVPRTVVLHPLPPRIIEIVPAYRGYVFFILADGTIVIVHPTTLVIVAVINV
jgi:hypothetical protein